MFCRLILVVLLVAFPLVARPLKPPELRLPDDVRPVECRVDLRIAPGQDRFSGMAEIDVDASRITPVVWLHAKELQLTDASVDGTRVRVEMTDTDFVALVPAQPLAPGQRRLRVAYEGTVSRNLTDGLFQQKEGEDWYVFSKFEPITARRAFPCFDEPSFKIPWQVTVRVPAGPRVFSNTPVSSETAEPDGTRVVRFSRTKPLPSYLVALAIGPFEVVDAGRVGKRQVPSRIIVPRGRAKDARPAVEATPKAIDLLEGYFGVPYPYEKLDRDEKGNPLNVETKNR